MIIHADMDAFYASVEIRKHPELRRLEMAVSGFDNGMDSALQAHCGSGFSRE